MIINVADTPIPLPRQEECCFVDLLELSLVDGCRRRRRPLGSRGSDPCSYFAVSTVEFQSREQEQTVLDSENNA